MTVTLVTATCRFSNLNKCVLLDEPLPAVLSLDGAGIFFLTDDPCGRVHA